MSHNSCIQSYKAQPYRMHNDKLSRRGVEWEELPYIGYITCVTVKGKVFSDLILEFYFILLLFVYQKDTLAQCAQSEGISTSSISCPKRWALNHNERNQKMCQRYLPAEYTTKTKPKTNQKLTLNLGVRVSFRVRFVSIVVISFPLSKASAHAQLSVWVMFVASHETQWNKLISKETGYSIYNTAITIAFSLNLQTLSL